MPNVITAGSTVKCAHQGTVQLVPSQQVLNVDGRAVLVMGDLEGKPISGCTVPATQSSKPCTTVVKMIAGAATKLRAGNKAVLLDTATGLTDGLPAPGNVWTVQTAGQTKLQSI
jgi:hypothetical protein